MRAADIAAKGRGVTSSRWKSPKGATLASLPALVPAALVAGASGSVALEADLVEIAIAGTAVGIALAPLLSRGRPAAPRDPDSFLAQIGQALRHSADSVLLIDADGTIRWVNAAFERLSGYTLAELAGNDARMLHSGVNDLGWYTRLWREVQAGRSWRGRFVYRRKDGSHWELDQTIAPIRDERGALCWLVAMGRDTSVESVLREQLAQAQKMELVGKIAGGVAHDFNNMLAVIISYSGLMRQHAPEGSPFHDDARDVEMAARRAAELSRRLLMLARHDDVHAELLDVAAVVAEVGRLLGRVIGESVKVEIDAPEGCWHVHADRTQLEQILLNLAINARDAMPAGGRLALAVENRTLECAAAGELSVTPGRWVELAVSDDGEGMSPETIARAFEPFFTTKGRDKGTGLGLSTVRAIVEASGGRVWIESKVSVGTAVRLVLPAAGGTRVDSGGAAPAEEIPAGSETLLVVEDEPAVLESMCRLLRRRGYHVLGASSVEDARALARGRHIDLLVCDVVLPDGGGERFAVELLGGHPALPVLFITGWREESLQGHAPGTRLIELLRKPFGEPELLGRVRALLVEAQARRSGGA